MKNRDTIRGHLNCLLASCREGETGVWNPTGEGLEGFDAMADSLHEVAKLLGMRIRGGRMTRYHIMVLSNQLLKQHGLYEAGWRFTWLKSTRTLGLCMHRKKLIGYSRHWTSRPDGEIRNTILHEIAHALAGVGHGHGPVWKRMAREIGAIPVRCAAVDDSLCSKKPKWVLACIRCRQVSRTYHVRPSFRMRRSCSRCCPDRFNEECLLEVRPYADNVQEPKG